MDISLKDPRRLATSEEELNYTVYYMSRNLHLWPYVGELVVDPYFLAQRMISKLSGISIKLPDDELTSLELISVSVGENPHLRFRAVLKNKTVKIEQKYD